MPPNPSVEARRNGKLTRPLPGVVYRPFIARVVSQSDRLTSNVRPQMTAEQIAYFALLASIVSLVISFLTLYRDRHVISVRAVPFESSKGVYNLNVTVANSGRRPISINHVLLRPPGDPGVFVDFAPNGQNRIDVGESRSCQVSPVGLPVSWSSVAELRGLDVYVQDAIGKKHKAVWEGS